MIVADLNVKFVVYGMHTLSIFLSTFDNVRFQVLTPVSMKMTVFWAMMEEVHTSETSVYFNKIIHTISQKAVIFNI
jgi:hypothetical protein